MKVIQGDGLHSLCWRKLKLTYNSSRVLVVFLRTEALYNEYARFVTYLSEHERDRAARFALEKLKMDYVCHRGTLRLLLSKIVELSPECLEFEATEFGKPYLKHDQVGLQFNLSHTENYVLYAFVQGRTVGVDIEEFRANIVVSDLAHLVLSDREQQEVFSLAPKEQIEAFLKLWTKKEALSKAIGQGLSIDVRDILQTTSEWECFDLSNALPCFGALFISR